MNFRTILTLLVGVLTAQHSLATSCMVIGDKAARVQALEGEKSPYFFTQACESLRLISGKAMVTWVAQDGKPNFAPIATTGPERVPSTGTQERSGSDFWTELTSRRASQRSASMRDLGEPKPVPIYIPAAGMDLPPKPGTALRIFAMEGESKNLVFETPSAARVRLTRDLIQPGVTYIVEWSQGQGWGKWKALSEQEMNQLDGQVQAVQAAVADEVQRRIVTAMLYRQLKLPVNAEQALSELHPLFQQP
jgi:hypothetical protein